MISGVSSRMSLWMVLIVAVGAFIVPHGLEAMEKQQVDVEVGLMNATKLNIAAASGSNNNNSSTANSILATNTQRAERDAHKENHRVARSLQQAASSIMLIPSSKNSAFGDTIGLNTALESHKDLTPAAGEHGKKYILVKKKPKHKKIKMEVYEPKMKYKKIKMKIPVKTLKKKKVKGYLVKKHHHHY